MGFGKDGKGAIIRENVTITVGNLAALTGILSTAGGRVSDSLGDDFRILKTEFLVSKIDQTSDEGTLFLYLVDGELTLAECEEAIELGGPIDRNDRLSQERAERYVKPVAMLVGSSDITTGGGPVVEQVYSMNPKWTFSNPEGWDWMAYNAGAILTAGTIIRIFATHYGVWVT